MAGLAISEENILFFKETHLVSQKHPDFQHFEKLYCFSRILRQFRYILQRKIFTFRDVNDDRLLCLNAVGNHRVKKTPI